jgi:hypothetical protein
MADRGEFLEEGMRHFFVRAMQLKQNKGKPELIDDWHRFRSFPWH